MTVYQSAVYAISCMSVATSCCIAATNYVSVSGTNNTPPFNSWGEATPNIQAAVDAAVDGDTVLMATGHYLLPQSIVINRKRITLEGTDTSGDVILDGGYPARTNRCLISNCGGTIRGITFTKGHTGPAGGFANVYGGALEFTYQAGYNVGFTIENCTFVNNTASSFGGAVHFHDYLHDITVKDCVFEKNSSAVSLYRSKT